MLPKVTHTHTHTHSSVLDTYISPPHLRRQCVMQFFTTSNFSCIKMHQAHICSTSLLRGVLYVTTDRVCVGGWEVLRGRTLPIFARRHKIRAVRRRKQWVILKILFATVDTVRYSLRHTGLDFTFPKKFNNTCNREANHIRRWKRWGADGSFVCLQTPRLCVCVCVCVLWKISRHNLQPGVCCDALISFDSSSKSAIQIWALRTWMSLGLLMTLPFSFCLIRISHFHKDCDPDMDESAW